MKFKKLLAVLSAILVNANACMISMPAKAGELTKEASEAYQILIQNQTSDERTGYSLHDLTDDGKDELIMCVSQGNGSGEYAIYTYKNGTAVPAFEGSEAQEAHTIWFNDSNHMLALFAGNRVWSDIRFFEINSETLVFKDVISNNSGTYYKGENADTAISETEYNAILNTYGISDTLSNSSYISLGHDYSFTDLTPLEVTKITDSSIFDNQFQWSLDQDGKMVISGSGEMTGHYRKDFDEYAPWYHMKSSIKEVIIENGVTHLASGLFQGCTNLSSVTIADSAESIGQVVFAECTSLTSVNIPDTITWIGNGAFNGCTSLKEITIPDNTTELGAYVFDNCTNLTSVIIKNPSCKIYDSSDTISNGLDENYNSYFNGTIYGYENSTAQAYAEKYGYQFKSLTSAVVPAENTTWNGVNPDINRDGILNAKDASLLLVYAAEFGAGNVKNFAEFMDKNYS